MSDGLCDIHITGFASLADVRLQPGRLTVLIGPNGSGKSNILRVLRMVPLMRTGSLQRFVGESGGAAALLHYGPKRTQPGTRHDPRLRPGRAPQRLRGSTRVRGGRQIHVPRRVGRLPADA
ncbi:MAG: AAA family ATPase [Bradymonadaceae bacterium]